MKNIVCLGNSLAGARALVDLRAANAEDQLTMVGTETYLPYHAERLSFWAAKRMAEEKILFQAKSAYANQNITFVPDKKIARINCKRGQIVMEDKETILFDQLLITDIPQWTFADIKGTGKSGVFGLRRAIDIKNILQYLAMAETVVVQASSLEQVQLALAIKERGKEVILAIPTLYLLPEILDQESSVLIMQYLEEAGLRVIYDQQILEILGEEDVKAVKFSSKKVMACEQVVLGDPKPDLRVFSDTEWSTSGEIPLSGFCRTEFDHVWVAGPLAFRQRPSHWNRWWLSSATLAAEGAAVAALMLGQDAPEVEDVFDYSFFLGDLTVRLVGESILKSGGREHMKFDVTGRSYKKLFISGDQLTGAVVIGASGDAATLKELVRTRESISGKEDALLDITQAGEGEVLPEISEAISG